MQELTELASAKPGPTTDTSSRIARIKNYNYALEQKVDAK